MKTLFKTTFALAAMLLLAPSFVGSAVADSGIIIKPNGAKKFAIMPADAPVPEGITYNSDDNEVIVGTFGGKISLLRYTEDGELISSLEITDGGPLLGLAYRNGKIYFCSADDLAGGPADSRIRRIDADLNVATLVDVAAVPKLAPLAVLMVLNPDGTMDEVTFGDGGRAPNDLTFASNGDLYFSDSFQGAVFKIPDPESNCPSGGCPAPTTVAHHGLLATTGFPPFGANGVAIRGDTLYVNNSGDDTVLKINLMDSFPAIPKVLTQSVNGADGLIYDSNNDLLWVAANQADQVVAVDPDSGLVVAELGEFLGIKNNGAPRGLLFPASLVEVPNGKILVTNLAVPLTNFNPPFDPPVIGDEWEEFTTKFTVSRINIPEFD